MANTKLIFALYTIITSLLVVSSDTVDIDVQPQLVRPNDEKVQVTCAGGNDTKKMLGRVFRMRLMKLDDDDQWKTVAVLRFDGTIEITDAKTTAVGQLGSATDSYIVVTWPIAPNDITNGRYRCDAIALTSTGDFVLEESKTLDIKSLSNDLSLVLKRLTKSEKILAEKVNRTLHDAIKSSEAIITSILDSNLGDLKEYVNNKTDVTNSFWRWEKEVPTTQWPQGPFTLLMPSDGCPVHPPAWIKSFERMKAQTSDKYYPIDVPLHVANPHKKDGFIYRQFCTLPESSERTDPWPAGSYCQYTMKEDCPTGFEYSELNVEILPDNGNFYLYYTPNKRQESGTFTVNVFQFCCRHDGNASTPVNLPVSHPFYLFRHGGRCQEVEGMDVTQDIFMMETEDDGSYDEWIFGDPEFHPDISFNPYKEELCYYSWRRV